MTYGYEVIINQNRKQYFKYDETSLTIDNDDCKSIIFILFYISRLL